MASSLAEFTGRRRRAHRRSTAAQQSRRDRTAQRARAPAGRSHEPNERFTSRDWFASNCHTVVESSFSIAVAITRTPSSELLVARKANLSLRNYVNATPIGIAIAERNERLVMLLIDAAVAAGSLDDETVCRAATVNADVIRFLLFKHRINLSVTRDDQGRTPLHCAVLRERRKCVQSAHRGRWRRR